MSIPTRFDVLMKDGTVIENESLFTLSYGYNLEDRNVWLNRFREIFGLAYKEDIEKYVPWFDDFDSIYVKHHEFVFNRNEIIKDN